MICETTAELLYRRGSYVQAMLAPLVGKPLVSCRYSSGRGGVNLAVFSGSEPNGTDVRDWRFKTSLPDLRGSYLERWIPSDEKRTKFYMDRAYLHLYRRPASISAVSEVEIIALHCDPNEPEKSEHALYKRGPHLHVTTAEQPLPHSHFALNLGHLEHVLSSLESLGDAFETAVEMLETQVLEIYRKSPPSN